MTRANLHHTDIWKCRQRGFSSKGAGGDENLWELESAALSEEPSKFCLLARKLYTSMNYLVQCAMVEN